MDPYRVTACQITNIETYARVGTFGADLFKNSDFRRVFSPGCSSPMDTYVECLTVESRVFSLFLFLLYYFSSNLYSKPVLYLFSVYPRFVYSCVLSYPSHWSDCIQWFWLLFGHSQNFINYVNYQWNAERQFSEFYNLCWRHPRSFKPCFGI